MKRFHILIVIFFLMLSARIYSPYLIQAMEGVELRDLELELTSSYEELILCYPVAVVGGKAAALRNGRKIILKNVKNGTWRPAALASQGSKKGDSPSNNQVAFEQLAGDNERDSIYRPSDGIVNVSQLREWPQPIVRNQMVLVRSEDSRGWVPVAGGIPPLEQNGNQDALLCEVAISEIRDRFREDRDDSFSPLQFRDANGRGGKRKGEPAQALIPLPLIPKSKDVGRTIPVIGEAANSALRGISRAANQSMGSSSEDSFLRKALRPRSSSGLGRRGTFMQMPMLGGSKRRF